MCNQSHGVYVLLEDLEYKHDVSAEALAVDRGYRQATVMVEQSPSIFDEDVARHVQPCIKRRSPSWARS